METVNLKIVSIVLPAYKTIERLKTEERILQSAANLFYRHGIKSITMDEIATQLGMSKKTIYQSFEDKDAIVTALMDFELKEQHKEMDGIRKNAVNAIDEIFKAMSCISATFSKITPSLFYDLQKFHPASWARFREFKEKKMQSFVEENLKNGIKQELYRKDINVKIMARFRMEQVELIFNPLAFPPDKFDMREVHLVILDHFVHGIVTLKGHRMINKYKHIKEED